MKVERKKKIVVVGSINMDLVACAPRIPVEGETLTGSDFHTYPGGKGANQAVAAARLGCPVQMIGRIGNDAFGMELKTKLAAAGVDVSTVMVSEGSSGVAVILVSEQGQNCIVISPGANALLTPADLDAHVEALRSATIVLTQLEIPLETVEHLAKLCEREHVPLVLDPAPARTLSPQLLKRVAWFTPNETEAAFYLDKAQQPSDEPAEIAAVLLEQGIGGVLLKLGSRGAYVQTATDAGTLIAPFNVKAIDTTAAGDAFNGAFAAGLLRGMDPAASASFAAAAAALSVTRAGAQPSMASRAEVEAMLLSADAVRHGEQPQ